MEQSINERIKLLYEQSGERSIRSYAMKLGVAPTTLNECIKGAEPRYSLLNAIMNGSPFVSSEWLLTGNGDYQKATPSLTLTEGRPYYNVDFIGGFDLIFNDQTTNPDYNINYHPYNKEGVLWCNLTGHSMEPEIGHGDRIAIKEVFEWDRYISLNETYAIVTKNDLRTVKRVRKGSDKNHWLLVPVNPAYDPQEIALDMIVRVFSVLGCIKTL